MALVSTLSVLTLNAVAVTLLGWAAWTAFQSREQPSAEPFSVLLATLTLWAILAFGSNLPELLLPSLASTLLDLGQFGTALLVPGIWTVYALSYTGRGTGLTWRRIVLLAGIVFPVLVVGLVIAIRPPVSVIEYVVATMLGTEILYLLVLFLYATYLLADLGGSHARVSNTQIAVLTTGVGAPYLVGLVGNNTNVANGAVVGLLLSGGLLTIAMQRYPVMTGFPKADYIARTRVVETLQEAVVVLDWDDHVLDCNQATVDLFDHTAATMIGEPIRSVIDGLEQTELTAGVTGTMTLQTAKGRRQFQYSVSAVDETDTDGEENPVARTVLFRDVTDRQTREQQLTVLNRVLRHNVRNNLDVVLAYADHIDEDEIQSGVRESATELLELSKKAREAEEVMTASTNPPEPVNLSDVAETVVDQFRTSDVSGELSLNCPDELWISSHRTVVQQALSELVENSLTHTGTDPPQVEVSVRKDTQATAEITVADNGPGLPEREQQILADGTETQLKHGQGIGLWIVNWAVTQLGGDLQFKANTPEGSIVTIYLHDMKNEQLTTT